MENLKKLIVDIMKLERILWKNGSGMGRKLQVMNIVKIFKITCRWEKRSLYTRMAWKHMIWQGSLLITSQGFLYIKNGLLQPENSIL
jgi:hypothetical protein